MPERSERSAIEDDRMSVTSAVGGTHDFFRVQRGGVQQCGKGLGPHERHIHWQDEQSANTGMIDRVHRGDDRRDLSALVIRVGDEACGRGLLQNRIFQFAIVRPTDDQHVVEATRPHRRDDAIEKGVGVGGTEGEQRFRAAHSRRLPCGEHGGGDHTDRHL